MGNVHAEITLRNGGDVVLARNGYIKERDIRSLTTTALVDTGAMTLVIGEGMREQLGLAITAPDSVALTGGAEAPCSITESVEVRWQDRTACVRAWVLTGDEKVLIGVIPLEDMNRVVDPVNETSVRSPKPKRARGLKLVKHVLGRHRLSRALYG